MQMTPQAAGRLKRARRLDRLASVLINLGGIAVIGSVILILVLIIRVTLPLFRPSSTEHIATFPIPGAVDSAQVLEIDVDEYMENGSVLLRDGRFLFFSIPDGTFLGEHQLPQAAEGASILHCDRAGNRDYSLHWSDGTVTMLQLKVDVSYDGKGARTIGQRIEPLATLPPVGELSLSRSAIARNDADNGTATRVDLLTDNGFALVRESRKKDLFGKEKATRAEGHIAPTGHEIQVFTLTADGTVLFAGATDGTLFRWDLERIDAPVLTDQTLAADNVPITALGMVFGETSLAVGGADGQFSTWFLARKYPDVDSLSMLRIHQLEAHPSAVTEIQPSRRNKCLLTLNESGGVHLDHMTSERHLLALESPAPLTHAQLSTRDNGIIGVTSDNRIAVWALFNPHPEISAKTLFGKVWYEGYDAPEYVWQSSASTDDFEPKLSLVPLIFGSLKGTFYAMIFAIPLALFGAVYSSQFTPFRIRSYVKSTVEIMAAIPSVVIGFLIALWLAPLVDRGLVTLILGLGFLPVIVVLFVIAWQPLRHITLVKRLERGYEFIVVLPLIFLAALLSYWISGVAEDVLFDGSFKQWLFQSAGQRYDQRNSIIIAFGLGIAVIPIIFTISEDALTNVPQSLKAASIAMGASRWQTVWRVVLPSASPGIFAAIIIGLGRAIGETMIVLMATGNTPVLDPSIFNGMRTLSANIAVEIPEAPLNGTLYRVLFLSAVILLLITSFLNTIAEVVRQRLRKKYGLHQ